MTASAASARQSWRHLAGAYWRVSALLEADLAAAGLPPLGWYEVLAELERAPGQHLRMCELAEGVGMSRSGLTRLVDRLEKESLIERLSCPKDRRVQHAQLTVRGAEMVARMKPVHDAGVKRHFSDRLGGTKMRQLSALSHRLMKDAG